MTPDLFAPEPQPFRLIQVVPYWYEAKAIKTENVLVDKDMAYRIGFGYAMAQANGIISSPPQTHEELDNYRAILSRLPKTPEEFQLGFDRLNKVFATYRRPLILILHPGESVV